MIQKMTFGEKRADVPYRVRPGAYAVVFDAAKERVAIVRVKGQYFLLGGGIENAETYEACLQREVLEEVGYEIRMGAYIGVAEQYLYANEYEEHILSEGYFYLAEFVGWKQEPVELDHELCWLPVKEATRELMHEHQAWAVKQALLMA